MRAVSSVAFFDHRSFSKGGGGGGPEVLSKYKKFETDWQQDFYERRKNRDEVKFVGGFLSDLLKQYVQEPYMKSERKFKFIQILMTPYINF
jgi:hypothetical protein